MVVRWQWVLCVAITEMSATTGTRNERTESGVRDDFENVVPVRNEGPASGLKPGAGLNRGTSNDDSTWRLSSGMPGG
jgi:hypothetical protein